MRSPPAQVWIPALLLAVSAVARAEGPEATTPPKVETVAPATDRAPPRIHGAHTVDVIAPGEKVETIIERLRGRLERPAAVDRPAGAEKPAPPDAKARPRDPRSGAPGGPGGPPRPGIGPPRPGMGPPGGMTPPLLPPPPVAPPAPPAPPHT